MAHQNLVRIAAMIVGLVLGTVVALAAAHADQQARAPDPARVKIEDFAFKGALTTIPVGTTVVWTNADDDPHTVTADDGSFDSGGLGQNGTYRHRFATPGRYAYHCSLHPYMKGVLVVREVAQ